MKTKIILCAVAAVALIGGLALYRFLFEPDAPTDRQVAAQPAYRMQIEGLRFYRMNQGQRFTKTPSEGASQPKGGTAPDSLQAQDAARNRELSPLF